MSNAERMRRKRDKRRGATLERDFLSAVIGLGQTNAATIRATAKASLLLDKLDVASVPSGIARQAEILGMTGTHPTVYTQTQTALREGVKLALGKIRDGTAETRDVLAGLGNVGLLIRSGRPTVDTTRVSIEWAKLISGASLGREGVPADLQIGDVPEDAPPEPGDLPVDLPGLEDIPHVE